MAYKRQSPLPISEGGTNTSTMTNVDGIIYFDGTKFDTTTVGTSGQLFTSQGAGSPPIFSSSSGAGTISIIATSSVTAIALSNITTWSIPYSEFGSVNGGGTQIQSQFPMPVAGTLNNMYVYLSTSYAGPDTNVILNKNMVNTALRVPVTGSSPAGRIFNNTINSITVIAGDLIQFECLGNGGNIQGQIVLQLTT